MWVDVWPIHVVHIFSFSFSELRFILNYFLGDNGPCNQPNNIDEGILLSFRPHEGVEWIPLAFYGVVYTSRGVVSRSGRVQINRDRVLTTDEVINIRGYSIPLNQNVLRNSEHVVKLCDETFVGNGVQFRWLQSAAHFNNKERTWDGWYLDNITVVSKNKYGCSYSLSENFEKGTE